MLAHFYHLLRLAHLAAAHSQALDWMRRRRMAFGIASADGSPNEGSNVVGWGLGSFGLRERRRVQEGSLATHDEYELSSIGSERRFTSATPQSIWWSRPLKQWRLQDRTSYG